MEDRVVNQQLKEALLAFRKLKADLAQAQSSAREPVAVIGMACRFPGGVGSPAEFWEMLAAGRDGIEAMPGDRWDLEAYYDPDPAAPGKMYVHEGGFLRDVAGFDHRFFGLSALEVRTMDPQQRILLECVWEAVEDAGIAMSSLAGSATGVYVGITADDYGKAAAIADPRSINPYTATGQSNSAAIGRISYQFGFQGPCMAVDTACSSSSVAIHLAMRSLRSGESDLALAGGINLLLTPHAHVALSKIKALSPDSRCKTYDASANGYVRSEGCGMLLLKRLGDAQRDGDRILAVIRGSAVNQDGHSNGLTAPNPQAQEKVIRAALKNAGLEPADIHYLETHGTGTPLGDPVELHAIDRVFGGTRHQEPLRIGSVKTNIGHLEPGAGVAGAIKVILSLQNGQLPPHLHFQEPSPHIPWGSLHLAVNDRLHPWPSATVPRRAGLSSFGYAGTNTHVVFEEAPHHPSSATAASAGRVALPLSAKTPEALHALAGHYRSLLSVTAEPLEHIAAAAGDGRDHFPLRLVVAGQDREELMAGIDDFLLGKRSASLVHGLADLAQGPRVAFLIAGQGAQYKGMFQGLYGAFPEFRAWMDRFESIFREISGKSLIAIIWEDGPEEELAQTQYTQPVLFATAYALAALYRSCGVEPQAVCGHSVGELVAAAVCGLFSPEDGFRLAVHRGAMMQALPEGGAMLSVFADEPTVSPFLAAEPLVSIAALNSPLQTVISGDRQALGRVRAGLSGRGLRSTLLEVSHAFHSPLMEPMLAGFRNHCQGARFTAMHTPLYSNVTGRKAGPSEPADAEFWVRHVMAPVRFMDGLQAMIADGLDTFVELGPGSTLTSLARQMDIENAVFVPSLDRKSGDVAGFLNALAHLYIRGQSLRWHRLYAQGPLPRVALPTYPFQRDRHWLPNVELQPILGKSSGEQPGLTYQVRWEPLQLPGLLETRFEYPHKLWICTANPDHTSPVLAAAQVLGIHAEVLGGPDSGFDLDNAAPEDWQRFFAANAKPRTAILFLHHSLGTNATDPERLEQVERGLQVFLAMSQAALARPIPVAIHAWTHRAQGPVDHAANPFETPMVAMHRCLGMEHPRFRGRLLDLDFERLEQDATAALNFTFSDIPAEDVALYGQWWVPRLSKSEPLPLKTFQPRPESAYLITGGLGSLGLATAKWLIESGARRLYLNGRGARPSESQLAAMDALRTGGAAVDYLPGDIAQEAVASQIIAAIQQAGHSLKGVFHVAGVNSPIPFAELKPIELAATLAPKLRGGYYLHQATRGLDLDVWVTYGSVAAVWGSARLGHYAAANAFLDGLCTHRQSLGLPATAIDWAAWEGSTMLQDESIQQYLQQGGMRLLQPSAALDVLGRVAAQGGQWIVADMDWERHVAVQDANGLRLFWDHLRTGQAAAAQPSHTGVPPLLLELQAADPSAREGILEQALRQHLSAVLGEVQLPGNAWDLGFFAMGMDSLRAIELRQVLERELGLRLAATVLFDQPTPAHLCGHLLVRLREEGKLRDQDVETTDDTETDNELDALRSLLKAKLST